MFCTHCGIKANLGDRFCLRCGRPVKQSMDLIRAPKPALNTPTLPHPVASQKARLVNYLFDYVGLVVYILLILIIVAYVQGFIGVYNQTAWQAAFEGKGSYIIGTLFFFSYYLFFETVFGRTPGKALTGTKVVTAAGAKPSFFAVLKRTASRFNPFELFSFFGSHHPHGWHDSVSETYVVKSR